MRFIYLLLFTIAQSINLPAQSYKLKKDIDTDEIDACIDSIKAPSKAEMQLTYRERDLEESPKLSQKEKEVAHKRIKQLFETNPGSLYWYKEYWGSFQAAYPEEKEKFEEIDADYRQKLEELYEKDSTNGEAVFYLSSDFLIKDNWERGFTLAQQAVDLMADSIKTWINLSNYYSQSQDFAKAKETSKKALSLDEQNLAAHIFYLMSDLFISLSQLNPEAPQKFSNDYSLIKAAEQKYENQSLTTLIHGAQLSEIYYNFIFDNLSKMKDTDFADAAFEQFKASTFEDSRLPSIKKYFSEVLKTRQSEKSFAYEALGFVAFINKDFASALDNFQKSLAENPDRANAYSNVFFIYVLEGKWENARELILKKLDYLPTSNDYCLLARVYSEMENDAKKLESLEQGLLAFPEAADILFYKALVDHQNGNYDSAAENIIKSVKINPTETDAILMYSAMALRANEIQSALEPLYIGKMRGNSMAAALFDTYFELE